MLLAALAPAQTAQVGADAKAPILQRLAVEHVAFRPARWDHTNITEAEPDFPNQGGLVSVYFRNTTDKPMNLRFWRLNGQDESYWRLNRQIAWDRVLGDQLAPGAYGVLEINGITPDFAEGKEFRFAYVDNSWMGAGGIQTTLKEDPAQVSFIRVLPGLQEVEVFVRQRATGTTRYGTVELPGHTVTESTWATEQHDGPGLNIARVKLAAPLASAQTLIVRVALQDAQGDRVLFAHRRAFADYFPIGTWGADEDLRDELHRMHIDTCVMGGSKTDSFWATDAARLGMKAMVHTGVITEVDRVREFTGHPNLAVWMLQDEPDWSIPAQQMLLADATVRRYDSTAPTFITLCRNTKFFEYAPIPDIACQDHYSVTAPSSSKWPKFYGTRLEETGIYTADLKAAAEPKPTWVWSQGLFDWDERPKNPVPTASELGVQLVQNLGYGAKGILWFSYKSGLGEKYPETRAAMTAWGRNMKLLREDLLGAEPFPVPVKTNDKVDALLLTGRDSALLCVTNKNYELDPVAYKFTPHEALPLDVTLPPWLAQAGSVTRIDDKQCAPVPFRAAPGGIQIDGGTLTDAALYLISPRAERATELSTAWQVLRDSEG